MNELLLRRRNKAMKKAYLHFADPLVEQICATNWGDGVGITAAQAAAVTDIGTKFKGTAITSFDELGIYFPNVKNLAGSAFNSCTSLLSIDLSKIEEFANYSMSSCTAISSTLYLTNVKKINGTSRANGAFYNAGSSNITIVIGENCTSIGRCFNDTKAKYFVFLPTTPPTLAVNAFYLVPSGYIIYVPYGCGNTYKNASGWSSYASHIYELNQDGTIPT